MDRGEFQSRAFCWLHDIFDGIYPNPQNAIIIPIGATQVVVDSHEFGEGRLAVEVRAAILQDLEPSEDLSAYVALNCNAFRFGNLYLFSVAGGKVDLDYVNKVMSTWIGGPEDLAELVAVAANNALELAPVLHGRFGGRLANPSEKVWHTIYIGPESDGRQDVWDALNKALETQACILMGTAERVELARVGALVDGWFVVNSNYLWFAGRNVYTRATVLWRIPHADITSDRPILTGGPATYTAQLANGDVLTVTTRTTDAATAIRDAHHDPRDLNHRWAA